MKYFFPLALVMLQMNLVHANEIRCPDFSGTYQVKSEIAYFPISSKGKFYFYRIPSKQNLLITQTDCRKLNIDYVDSEGTAQHGELQLQLEEGNKTNVDIKPQSVHYYTEMNPGHIQFQEGALAYIGPSRDQNFTLKLKPNGDLKVSTIAGRLIVGIGLIRNPMASKPSKRQFDFIRID